MNSYPMMNSIEAAVRLTELWVSRQAIAPNSDDIANAYQKFYTQVSSARKAETDQ